MKTLIVTATRKNPSNAEQLELIDSLRSFPESSDFEISVNYSNEKGLPEVYNSYLTEEIANKYDCIIYVHDDVYIDDIKVFSKIHDKFKEGIGVVGLAGASEVKLKIPALWHLMSDRESWSGAVAHPVDDESIYVTSFGPVPKRCVIMDGLFLAVKPLQLIRNEVYFDEQFKFHHYDIDFCLQCNKAGIKMSTTNINAIHVSPGLSDPNDKDYLESQSLFKLKHVKD